jgi:hypothetical protein
MDDVVEAVVPTAYLTGGRDGALRRPRTVWS